MEWLKAFIFDVQMKKGAKLLAQYAATYALTHLGLLQKMGITVHIDPDLLQGTILVAGHVAINKIAHWFPNVKFLQALATSGAPAAQPPATPPAS